MKFTIVLSFLVYVVSLNTGAFAQADSSAPAAVPTPTMQQAGAKLQAGQITEAEKMFEAIHIANPKNGQAWLMHGYTVHMQGRHSEALPLHQKAATFPNVRAVALYNVGCVNAIQGRSDEAFDALRLAVDAGKTTAAQLEGDTDLASLHDDERWQELVDRINAAQTSLPATAMHFWVGDWDCYSPNGSLSGTNKLELINNNMFIHEQWTNAQGQVGQSFNYYDIEIGKWKQIWVDPTRQLEITADPTTPGRLLFEGFNYDQAGVKAHRQMLVLDLGDGRVLQEGRASKDGESWTVTYRLIYMPKGEEFNSEGLPKPGEG
jgi:tetratricopeptide (TPR) repeat protein